MSSNAEADEAVARPVAVLDFEATCLPMPGVSFPIEVALAFVDTGAVRSWLIRPTERWAAKMLWDPTSARLHGITREMLDTEGLPAEQVLAELTEAAAGHAVVSDNRSGDGFWLEVLATACDRDPPFRIEAIQPMIEGATFAGGLAGAAEIEAAAEKALRRFPRQHRAGDDARRLAEILRILLDIDQ